MALSTTRRDRERLALEALALKLRLENKIKTELRKHFRKVGKRFEDSYRDNGSVPNVGGFESGLQEILKKHYRRVFKVFRNKGIKCNDWDLVEYKQDDTQKEQEDAFFNQHSQVQATLINGTTQKELSVSLRQVLLELQQQEEETISPAVLSTGIIPILAVSRSEIARKARTRFLRRQQSRVDAIALTETQNPAERAKEITAQSILRRPIRIATGQIATAQNSQKIWTAILDNRVREAHADADDQRRQINEPFEVGGELLMHPGDTSLGAGPANVIRCRCNSSVAIEIGEAPPQFQQPR